MKLNRHFKIIVIVFSSLFFVFFAGYILLQICEEKTKTLDQKQNSQNLDENFNLNVEKSQYLYNNIRSNSTKFYSFSALLDKYDIKVGFKYPEILTCSSQKKCQLNNYTDVKFSSVTINNNVSFKIYKFSDWYNNLTVPKDDLLILGKVASNQQKQKIKNTIKKIYNEQKISNIKILSGDNFSYYDLIEDTNYCGDQVFYDPNYSLEPYYIASNNNKYRGFAILQMRADQRRSFFPKLYYILYNQEKDIIINIKAEMYGPEIYYIDHKLKYLNNKYYNKEISKSERLKLLADLGYTANSQEYWLLDNEKFRKAFYIEEVFNYYQSKEISISGLWDLHDEMARSLK